MSKRESNMRQSLIIDKIKRAPATFREIQDFLKRESEIVKENYNLSKRTFERDKKEIESLFNIEIEFNKKLNAYEIINNKLYYENSRILEAFNIYHALNSVEKISDFIHFENRRPLGTENLHGLIHAIKNRFQIKFLYQKYWDADESLRTAEPYALKEFQNRWYVLAVDHKDKKMKSFALDRLSALEILMVHFQFPQKFDVNEHYKHCFGITSPNNLKLEEIILSFTPEEGKYIKSLPLHESQQIIDDNEKETLVKLTLFITHEFIMEILSHGDAVKVIKPSVLVKKIKTIITNTQDLYK